MENPQLSMSEESAPQSSFETQPPVSQKETLKKIFFLISGVLLMGVVGVSGYYLGAQRSNNPASSKIVIASPSPTSQAEKDCTMEAKICPDGSWVGRSAPNCEFAECPVKNAAATENWLPYSPSPTSQAEKDCTMEAKICPDGSWVGRSAPNCEFAECPVKNAAATENWLPYSSGKLAFKYAPGWFASTPVLQDYEEVRVQNYDPATAPGRGYDPLADRGKFIFVIFRWSEQYQKLNKLSELKAYLTSQDEQPCYYQGDESEKRVSFDAKEQVLGKNTVYSRATHCSKMSATLATYQYYVLDGEGNILLVQLGSDSTEGRTYILDFLSTFSF